MRKELELIEKIEHYLDYQLTGAERTEMETEIFHIPGLREEIQLQEQIRQGLERIVLKQTIRREAIRFKRTQGLTRWGLLGLCTIGVIGITFYSGNKPAVTPPLLKNRTAKTDPRVIQDAAPAGSDRTAAGEKGAGPKVVHYRESFPHYKLQPLANREMEHNRPGLVIPDSSLPAQIAPLSIHVDSYLNEKDRIAADSLPAQIFSLDPGRDTIVATENGIHLAIPAFIFLDDKGQFAQGKVQLIVREAPDKAAMIRAGLAVRPADLLPESAGMFCLEASDGGTALKIDPSRAINAEVPAGKIKMGMQLYNGERQPDGSIKWIDHAPINYDIIRSSGQVLVTGTIIQLRQPEIAGPMFMNGTGYTVKIVHTGWYTIAGAH